MYVKKIIAMHILIFVIIISFRRKDIFSQNRAKDAGLKIFQMSLLTISEERLVFRLKYIRQSRKYQKYVARVNIG